MTAPFDDVQEIYMRCTMCHWEQLLDHTTEKLELLNKRWYKAMQRGRLEEKRLGTMTNSTYRITATLSAQIALAERELEKRLAEAVIQDG